jgi:hypothetical protein
VIDKLWSTIDAMKQDQVVQNEKQQKLEMDLALQNEKRKKFKKEVRGYEIVNEVDDAPPPPPKPTPMENLQNLFADQQPDDEQFDHQAYQNALRDIKW